MSTGSDGGHASIWGIGVRKIITGLILAATMFAGTAAFTGAAAASRGPARTYVYADGMGPRWGGPRIRPAEIAFGALYDVARLRWSKWGSSAAYARGHFYAGRGGPSYQAYIALYNVRVHHHRRYFSWIKIAEPGHKTRYLQYRYGIWHTKLIVASTSPKSILLAILLSADSNCPVLARWLAGRGTGTDAKGTVMRAAARRWLPARSRLSRVRQPALVQAIVGAAGLAVLAIGAVKFATTAGDSGAITMVVTGGVLVILPLVLDRVQRISLHGSGLELWLDTEVTGKGAPETAKILGRTDLGNYAQSYALAHAELTGPGFGDARKRLQDLLVRRAAAIATLDKFSAREVRTLFATGSPAVRVLALGLMQGDISLADITTITAAIGDSRSANEQYQGLQLAFICQRHLTPADWQKLPDTINHAHLPPGSDRDHLARQLLSRSPTPR
jgi:hypothetical protein